MRMVHFDRICSPYYLYLSPICILFPNSPLWFICPLDPICEILISVSLAFFNGQGNPEEYIIFFPSWITPCCVHMLYSYTLMLWLLLCLIRISTVQRVTWHTVHRCLHDKLRSQVFELGHMLLLLLVVWGTSLCPVSKWVRFTHALMDCVWVLPSPAPLNCILFIFVAILNEVAWNVKAVFISALGTFPMKRISDATQLPCFVSDSHSVECECWLSYTLLYVNVDCRTVS